VETKKELAEKRKREANQRKKVENMQASQEKAQGDGQVGVIPNKRKNVSIFD
jgi:hypothetical protein